MKRMMRTSDALIERIADAARASAAEICGALIGDGRIVAEAVPLANESTAADHAFLISAAEVMRIERAAERDGRMLMGFYHSHPAGEAVPSPTDVDNALPGFLYWIASRAGVVRAWRLRDDRSCFDEVTLES